MKIYLGKEACPNCNSRDNVGVWSDGQKWCFGCGYYVPGYKSMSVEDIRKQIKYDENKEKKQRVVYLPDDFTHDIPAAALEWLQKYGVTDEERKKFRIGWTENEPALPRSLVYPAFDVFGNLLLVQFRSFNPKNFYTRGHPESVYWSVQVGNNLGPAICVVEDFISCIKVGRHCDAMPLWGSNLSLNQIRRLSDHYEVLQLWLDWDKLDQAVKLRIKALPYFREVHVIATDNDPKDYNDDQLRIFLGQDS